MSDSQVRERAYFKFLTTGCTDETANYYAALKELRDEQWQHISALRRIDTEPYYGLLPQRFKQIVESRIDIFKND